MKISVCIPFLLFPMLSAAQSDSRQNLDSLVRELSFGKYAKVADTNKVKLYNSIAQAYLPFNRDSTIIYANRGLNLSEKLGYKIGQGACLTTVGSASYNFNTTLSFYHRSLKIFEQSGDKHSVAGMLGSIGGVYFNIENFPKALDYFLQCKKGYEDVGDEAGVARSNHSLAATYINLNMFPKALEHESLALKYFEKEKMLQKMAAACSNMGNCYAGLRQYNKAILYSSKATNLSRSLPNNNNSTYGTILSERGYIHYLIASDKTTSIHPDSLVPASREANLEKALQYYTEAYDAYRRKPDFSPVDILSRLSIIYAAMGRYQDALLYQSLYHTTKDSLLTQDMRLKIAAQETMREADLKENQIKINRIQAANDRKVLISLLILMVLLAVRLFIMFRNYKKKKRLNTELATAVERLAAEKTRSDELAVRLQESIIQKDAFAAHLAISAEMKTRFLANISHELRTPVTLLTGMLELMKDNAAPFTTANGERGDKERLDVAYNNSRKLQYMVEEILDLSRLETLNSKKNTEVVNIVPIIKRMVYAFETFIEKEHLSLQYDHRGLGSVYVRIDENMLEKMVNNLVYNAIKFNERGGWIKVKLFLSANHRKFIFTINNSGTLITETDLPHVFERFYQGNTKAAKADGVGIGLSLVKEFAMQMGGNVEAQSTLAEGTTFTVNLPVTDEVQPEKPESDTIEALPELWDSFPVQQTVLIVEDNAEMRYYLQEVLAGKVILAEAPNGRRALEWLAENKADLIISDLMMPEMDGKEFIAYLKSSDEYKDIPVFTLTALSDVDSRVSTLRMGIDDYIVKPFNAMELRIRVYNLLSNSYKRVLFESEPMEPEDISPEVNDAAVFRKQITEFLSDKMNIANISVYDVAYALAMSERQLYRLAKRLTGCSPAQLIKEVKLQRAYELLLSGTINKVEDVARQVGYEDTSYFSRLFYQRFGKRVVDFL